MQQQIGGGGAPSLSGYGDGGAAEMMISDEDQKLGDLGIAEAASPISSRPPAPAAIGRTNFEEMIQATAEAGGSSGNRWPREETLALLQIRSEMDAAFRDASLKGPLWEQVSRKLAEMGYQRSAKKCREKFENVHKYYKRTKEGRSGRQDGKSYKFFTQLEALNHNIATAAQIPPRLASSASTDTAASLPPPPPITQPTGAAVVPDVVTLPPPDHTTTVAASGSAVPLFGNIGVSFSSNSSSYSDEEDEEDNEEMESTENRNQRKRKRSDDGNYHSDEGMMDFFEGLLNQVMEKQEAMQQKFLEAVEKREQDRMIREEAWKRQDMARVAREHDLMAQERAISASRDAAIIAFLEKITRQTIHLPTTVPQYPPPPTPAPTAAAKPQEQHHRQPTFPQQNQPNQLQSMDIMVANQATNTSDIVAVASEPRHLTGGSSIEMTSSRWPKTEVLALIRLRSGMELKYQEAGSKGPLWEEMSAGMQRMGYNRSAKRCKEKWENINKYFKKVKESNRKRPEDAKTCPYFHELDALYRQKIIGNMSGNVVDVASAHGSLSELQQPLQSLPGNVDGRRTQVQTSGAGAFPAGEHTQGNTGGENQPEDMVKTEVGQRQNGDMMDNCSIKNGCSNSNEDNYEEIDDDEIEDSDDDDSDEDEKTEEEMKMVYKIQFQTPNERSSNPTGGTSPSSFVAMLH